MLSRVRPCGCKFCNTGKSNSIPSGGEERQTLLDSKLVNSIPGDPCALQCALCSCTSAQFHGRVCLNLGNTGCFCSAIYCATKTSGIVASFWTRGSQHVAKLGCGHLGPILAFIFVCEYLTSSLFCWNRLLKHSFICQILGQRWSMFYFTSLLPQWLPDSQLTSCLISVKLNLPESWNSLLMFSMNI